MSSRSKSDEMTLWFKEWRVAVGSNGIFFQTLLAEGSHREVSIVWSKFGSGSPVGKRFLHRT
jgi:hypothetical protein